MLTPLTRVARRFGQLVNLPDGSIEKQISLIEDPAIRMELRALLEADRRAQRTDFLACH